MSQKTKERICLVYGIVLSILILAVGLCFALSCLSLYRSGDSPFTSERIAEHFRRIAVPTYACVAAILGGCVLSWVMPGPGCKTKPRRQAEDTLNKLSAMLDLNACEASLQTVIRSERRFRRVTTVAIGSLAALTMLPALIWCVNPAHFSIQDLNADIRAAATILLPCAAVALGMGIACVLLCGASVAREITAVKSALASDRGRSPEKKPSNRGKNSLDPRVLWGIRGALLAVGVLFVALGIRNGGMADVLGKAIRICTECIGLG